MLPPTTHRCRPLIAAFLAPTPAVAAARDATLYLAPTGNDALDGLSPATALLTPARALARIREIRAADPGPISVLFADGTYALDEPLRLTARDTGPITFRVARDNGDVLISGGRALTAGWTSRPYLAGRLYALAVDPLPDGRLFRDLYYKNARCLRARFPNPTFERFKYTTITAVPGTNQDRFQIAAGPPGLGPLAPIGMEVVAARAWVMPRQLVDARASHGTLLICNGPLGAASGSGVLHAGEHIYLENWPAFIDVPLEWTLTRGAPAARGPPPSSGLPAPPSRRCPCQPFRPRPCCSPSLGVCRRPTGPRPARR